MDKICTEKLHQNHSNSSKYAFKLLLENNDKISFFFILSFQPSAAQNALKTARPGLPRAHRPHPGRNLGLGRQNAARARARLGRRVGPVNRGRSSQSNGRAAVSRGSKSSLRSAPWKTLAIRLFPSLSPRCFSLLSRSGDGHRRAAASEENRSELWRRRWPPRRRACSPTGEHAAVERPSRGAFLAEPGEFAPRLGFFFGAGEKSRCASSSSSAPVVVYPRRTACSFFSRSSPSPFFPIPTHGN